MSLECVVLYRSNTHDDAPVEAVLDSNGIVVFANMDLAIAYCDYDKTEVLSIIRSFGTTL